jgi:Ca2+/Na+ antiporter
LAVLIMFASAGAIVLLVKLGLLRALDQIANAMNWSPKARGQVTGYATSVPELVCLVSAGLAGVWEAGLWNIASSNMINGGLMFLAVGRYRQLGELFNLRFADELLFAALAIVVPVVLMQFDLDTEWFLIPLLLGLFAVYQIVDRQINRTTKHEQTLDDAVGNLPFGLILGLTALVAIIVAGVFLGDATATVVRQMGIHPTVAGWILGIVTSIPEMVTFFAVYEVSRSEGRLHELNDTQEALDNLTGSNMANVGVVYPLGLFAFLLVTVLSHS